MSPYTRSFQVKNIFYLFFLFSFFCLIRATLAVWFICLSMIYLLIIKPSLWAARSGIVRSSASVVKRICFVHAGAVVCFLFCMACVCCLVSSSSASEQTFYCQLLALSRVASKGEQKEVFFPVRSLSCHRS